MKTQLLAVPILVALMLSPALAAATTGTLTFTSPTAGTSLSGTQSYTISGTISPVPTPGTDNVNIQVTNPSGQIVDVEAASVSNTGTFSVSTNAGGSSAWTTGTYKISASDSNGASNTITFAYTATNTQPTSTTAITVVGNSNAILFAGQTAQIYALAYWDNNGTAVKTATWTVTVLGPTGSAPSPAITWTKSSPSTGVALWTGSIPAGSTDGVYAVEISASDSGVTGWTQTSFQVNSQVASTSGFSAITTAIAALGKNVSGLSSAVASINTAVAALTSSVNSINSAVSGITSSLSSISSTLGTVNSNVQGLGTTLSTLSSTVNTISSSIGSISSSITTLTNDVTQMQSTITGLQGLGSDMTNLQSSVSSLSTSVSNAQTYILVVAALAVITLVLELAILIRKLS